MFNIILYGKNIFFNFQNPNARLIILLNSLPVLKNKARTAGLKIDWLIDCFGFYTDRQYSNHVLNGGDY